MHCIPSLSKSSWLISLALLATLTLSAGAARGQQAAQSAAQPAPSGAVQVPKVSVTDSAAADQSADGTREQGYATKSLESVGSWGAMDKLDAPYSFVVIPQALLDDTMASTPNDLFKLMPFSQTTTGTRYGYGAQVQMRGYDSSVELIDGFRTNVGFQSPEMYERAEILTGSSGFLYGNAVPGGVVNVIQKRPTAERFADVTVGSYGNEQAFAHADVGGPLGSSGVVGYRVNALVENGDAAVDDQRVQRRFLTGALDIKTGTAGVLQLDGGYEYFKVDHKLAAVDFDYSNAPLIVPDNNKSWGQPFSYVSAETSQADVKYRLSILDNLTSRTGVMYRRQREASIDTINVIEQDASYTSIVLDNEAEFHEQVSYYQYFDLDFNTLAVKHKLTLAFSGDQETTHVSGVWWDTSGVAVASGNINDGPVYGPLPSAADFGVVGDSKIPNLNWTETANSNLSIGDQIRFTDAISALVGVNHANIKERDFNPTSGELRQLPYDRSENSPTASLIGKPTPWSSVYLTYIEALEEGAVAPDDAVNKDEVLAPFVSKEWELGAKANWGGANYTVAVFSIDKAYAYTNAQNFFVEDGRQKDTGIEIGVFGKVLQDLTLFGGATHMSPRISGGDDNGLVPVRVSRDIAKLRAEFDVAAIPGLTLVGGAQYYGPWYWSDDNTLKAPSTTLVDLGLRYRTTFGGKEATFRLDVNNALDKSYYSSTNYLGDPRSIAFSAQMHF